MVFSGNCYSYLNLVFFVLSVFLKKRIQICSCFLEQKIVLNTVTKQIFSVRIFQNKKNVFFNMNQTALKNLVL